MIYSIPFTRFCYSRCLVFQTLYFRPFMEAMRARVVFHLSLSNTDSCLYNHTPQSSREHLSRRSMEIWNGNLFINSVDLISLSTLVELLRSLDTAIVYSSYGQSFVAQNV